MTIGVSLAISIGAGLHAASGTVVHRLRFRASWGKTEVFVSHSSSWDLTHVKSWQHTINWSIWLAVAHATTYGLRLESFNRHGYGDMRMHRNSMVLGWTDLPQARLSHAVVYSDLILSCKSMRLAYWLTGQVKSSFALGYDVTDVNPVASRLAAPWAVLNDASLQALNNGAEMVCKGRKIPILHATLSADEDSPVWLASLEIADLADFAAIDIGDAFTLSLGLEHFVLVVDGKSLSRLALADQRCELTALSPVALLDSPFASKIRCYQAQAQSARFAVQALIGSVNWEMPDWIIPAGRLMLDGVTPLGAARNIVAAIGGIVESNPDGIVVCRLRHPLSIPQYTAAAVTHSLFDSDVISARSQIAPSRGFNRVTIANVDASTGTTADRIEYLENPLDDGRGTVRAYLATPRPVALTHTGHVQTVVASLGEIVRSESELVEFIEGRASTRYPVYAITSFLWQHTDLGEVSAEGQNLTAAVAGFSLLHITYTVMSLNWQVALAMNEEVQFVLVDS